MLEAGGATSGEQPIKLLDLAEVLYEANATQLQGVEVRVETTVDSVELPVKTEDG
jgi:hypothetical protein